MKTGSSPKNQEISQRITPKPVCPMEASSYFSCCKKALNRGHRSFRFNTNSSHNIVAGGAYFHGSTGNIQVAKFHELVIHTGQFLFYVFCIPLTCNIQKCTSMRTSSSSNSFTPYSFCNNITSEKLRGASGFRVSFKPT